MVRMPIMDKYSGRLFEHKKQLFYLLGTEKRLVVDDQADACKC